MNCSTCLRGTPINESKQLYACTENTALPILGESYDVYQNRTLLKAEDQEGCELYISRGYYPRGW